MRLQLTCALVFISVACQAQGSRRKHELSVTSSLFTIQGSTNINQFRCSLQHDTPSDTLQIKSSWSNGTISFEDLILTYPVKDFDCGLQAMNKDLQQMLNSEETPFMTLQVESIHLKKSQQAISQVFVTARVKLTIRGVSQPLLITDGMVINHSESSLTFSGNVALDMRDFHMNPPIKFWGMVQVNEMLHVNFSVSLEVENL